jgi:hypothetical protein
VVANLATVKMIRTISDNGTHLSESVI